MSLNHICVTPRTDRKPNAGQDLLQEANELGYDQIKNILPSRLFWLPEDVDDHLEQIATDVVSDPIVERYHINDVPDNPFGEHAHSLVVRRKPGVMDPVALSLKQALNDLEIHIDHTRTGQFYWIDTPENDEYVRSFALDVLANDVIEDLHSGTPELDAFPDPEPYSFDKQTFPMRDASLDTIREWNRKNLWSLNDRELETIQSYFNDVEERDPTDLEVETIAQTWSEHCKHKTLTGKIEYDGRTIDNLLEETVVKATEEVGGDWCLSVFKDNAGIVGFTEDWGISFKVETHNHPSAIEPYGGSGTGIGGVIRDILGCGRGSTPIMNTDVFCVAPPDRSMDSLPENVLHPRRVLKGVVSGVRDYGNRMGIPTANGAVFFDDRYLGNPLVFCGTVGKIPRDRIEKGAKPGDNIVAVGGRTGRDGIHGATFSSAELETDTVDVAGSAVQIGNAITEKRVADAILAAREKDLYTGITDCGAGGFSSAIGETGEDTGVEVHLEKAPLKYEGLSYTEIWISESQERMVLSVPDENLDELFDICEREGVEAAVLGNYTDTGRLVIKYEGHTVGDLDMEFLHDGLPEYRKEAEPVEPVEPEGQTPEPEQYEETLHSLLSAWNVCSKHWIVRQYDHEVQGRTVVKPLVGKEMDGPGDAAVIRPVPSSDKGLAVGCGMAPRYGDMDAYEMAANGIDEAVRNVVATGANPDRIALLDNFAWGSPERPELLGKLVQAAQACYDLAVEYETPFVSGKDSLYNEFQGEDETLIIPPTLLISACGIVPDLHQSMTMDLKRPGNHLFMIGTTRDEMGGSEYSHLQEEETSRVPEVRPDEANQVFSVVHDLIQNQLVDACHDISEGGLGVAAAEMAFAGGVGLDLQLDPSADSIPLPALLFSQSPSRFLVEVSPKQLNTVREHLERVPHTHLGETTEEQTLTVTTAEQENPVIEADLDQLKSSWRAPLDWN
jgi:phosphoribosylformylglycinamidine synthase